MTNETMRRFEARRERWRRAVASVPIEGRFTLDAGTGEGHSTLFLAERRPARLTSVTCRADEITPAKTRLGSLADRVEFVVEDLTGGDRSPRSTTRSFASISGDVDPTGRIQALPPPIGSTIDPERSSSLRSGSFDVVFADFLVAAAAAYSPFREDVLIERLLDLTRPGGTIVITGWEASAETDERILGPLKRCFAFREAVHLLAGNACFREHPSSWVVRRLAGAGVEQIEKIAIADVHRDFRWFFEQTRSNIGVIADLELRRSLSDYADRLERETSARVRFESGIEFGRLYAVVATKPVNIAIERK
jgi:predicted O-methyltransferase YrrM